ncbi:MAG: rhomboid family intramembrane serine protease [Deferribacterales bacterium]|nr:rhomboid family intramembrane serine protease [Deferribacterales bacterium]
MFPVKSLTPSNTFPLATLILILTNAGIFIYMLQTGLSGTFFIDYGIVPAKLGMPSEIVPFQEKILPFFSYMFIHGGWLHIIFNMYFLYIFGPNVEGRLGHGRYIVSYIVFGITGAIVYVILSPTDGYPMVGASGAVAGVMGAYLIFFPTSKIKTLLIIIIFITFINIPAVVFIGLWFAAQLSGALVDGGTSDSIAWWAHVGGFVAGMVLALFVRITQGNDYLLRKTY